MQAGTFFGGLKNIPLQLAGGGAAQVGVFQPVPLVEGKRYELRCSDKVHVRPSGGDVRASDLQVTPDAPLTFRADCNVMHVAAGSNDALAWVRAED